MGRGGGGGGGGGLKLKLGDHMPMAALIRRMEGRVQGTGNTDYERPSEGPDG